MKLQSNGFSLWLETSLSGLFGGVQHCFVVFVGSVVHCMNLSNDFVQPPPLLVVFMLHCFTLLVTFDRTAKSQLDRL